MPVKKNQLKSCPRRARL